MHTICSVGLQSGLDLSPRADCIGELLEDFDGRIPVDAGIGDGDALLESGEATRCWSLLVAFVDVRLDHDTDDAVFTLAELVANGLCDLGLVPVVLERVACTKLVRSKDSCSFLLTMRAVDHHDLWEALLAQSLPGSLDIVLVVVGALCSTTQNHEAVWVTSSLRNSSKTLLRHTHEMMLRSSSANGIHRNRKSTIRSVLEAHGER